MKGLPAVAGVRRPVPQGDRLASMCLRSVRAQSRRRGEGQFHGVGGDEFAG